MDKRLIAEKILRELNTLAEEPTCVRPTKFYPVSHGYGISSKLMNITNGNLSKSLVVYLRPAGGKEGKLCEVAVRKIALPKSGETLQGYHFRIEEILKDLDDRAKFVEIS